MPVKSALLALFVIAIWGANIVAIRAGVLELAPLTFLTLRYGLTALTFLPFMRWPGREQALIICQIGLLMGMLHQGCLYAGLEYLEAGTMAIVLQAQVILNTLLGWLFLKEVIGWRTWAGIACGLSGIIILFGGPDLSAEAIGLVLGLLSAFFVAISNMRMKALKTVHPLTFIALMNLSTALPILPISYALETDVWHHLAQYNWSLLGGILAIQVFVLSATHVFWQRLLAAHPVSQVVPWTLLMPVFGAGFAWLLLDEPITITMMAGGVLTIAGVGIIMIRRIQKGAPLASDTID